MGGRKQFYVPQVPTPSVWNVLSATQHCIVLFKSGTFLFTEFANPNLTANVFQFDLLYNVSVRILSKSLKGENDPKYISGNEQKMAFFGLKTQFCYCYHLFIKKRYVTKRQRISCNNGF